MLKGKAGVWAIVVLVYLIMQIIIPSVPVWTESYNTSKLQAEREFNAKLAEMETEPIVDNVIVDGESENVETGTIYVEKTAGEAVTEEQEEEISSTGLIVFGIIMVILFAAFLFA